jgi:hypothetical protein
VSVEPVQTVTFVEVDLPRCTRTYGVAPCTASIPATGDIKCFNCIRTCQDRANYEAEVETVRFSLPNPQLPNDLDYRPYLDGQPAYSPATVSLGKNLGVRASLQVKFRDAPDPDTGPAGDRYLADRDYNPYERGTFFGRWRARYPFIRGVPIRLIRGELGQAVEDMATYHFVGDSFDGPRPDGSFSITAKDVLKLADDDRALAPAASNGRLLADINNSTTAATLTPSGIGNAEYAASGYVCIGGNEVCAFTRSGDALTLTRGQFNTVAIAHENDERVQQCLYYDGIEPDLIIADLLVIYAGIDINLVNFPAWAAESDAYLQRVYTALITEPTGVNTLVCELIEQAALMIWYDPESVQIQYRVLRNVTPDADVIDDNLYLKGSLTTKEQPETRISQVHVFYARRNPTRPLTDQDNYKSLSVAVDADSEFDNGSSAIARTFARWVPEFGLSIADRISDLKLGRYRFPPRKFQFALFRGTEPASLAPGASYYLEAWPLQDATGARESVPVTVTRVAPEDARFLIEAEEAIFATLDPVDLSNRTVTIDGNAFNLNVRDIHDSIFPEITDPYGITLTVIVQPGVTVGSESVSVPALDIGTFPLGLAITVRILGRVQGKGGRGAVVDQAGTQTAAESGGVALYTRQAITLDLNTDGELFGGGGGGGARYLNVFYPTSPFASSNHVYWLPGGGGAGFNPGAGAAGFYKPGGAAFQAKNSADGTSDAGGLADHSLGPSNGGYGGGLSGGNSGGDGGDPGQAGDLGTANQTSPSAGGFLVAPGAAGAAIDGDSYVTISVAGDLRGPQIN